MVFTFTFTKSVFHHGSADNAGVWLTIGDCCSKNLVVARVVFFHRSSAEVAIVWFYYLHTSMNHNVENDLYLFFSINKNFNPNNVQ